MINHWISKDVLGLIWHHGTVKFLINEVCVDKPNSTTKAILGQIQYWLFDCPFTFPFHLLNARRPNIGHSPVDSLLLVSKVFRIQNGDWFMLGWIQVC